MTRIRRVAVLLFISMAMAISSQVSAKNYNWTLAQTWDKNSLFSEAVNRFVELTENLSGGRLTIKVDTQEDHKKSSAIFDMVQQGEYQMGHAESSYWRKKDRNTLFFSSVPFGMITPEIYSWFYHGGGMELMEKVYSQYGLLSFPGGNTGNQMVGWFRREVQCIEGLKGMTMRMTGIAGEVMRNIGVNIVDMPSNQLYPALDEGELDAVGYIGPAVDFDLGFYKIAPFYYTGWSAPSSEMQFLINDKAFKELPDDLQNIVVKSMRLAAYDMYFQSYHVSATNLKNMRAEYPDIKIRSFPSSVIRELRKQTDWQLAELAEFGAPLTREILESIKNYKDDARVWTRISDQAYLNNAGL